MTNAETSNAAETPAVAEQGAKVAPEKASSKKEASRKKGAPKGQKTAKKAKTSARKRTKAAKGQAKHASKLASKVTATEGRPGSKKAVVLDLLRRPKGATMAEISKATGWKNHSIRGFISGALGKKMGLKIESSKNDVGDRTYRL